MKKEILAAVLVVLVAAGLAAGYVAGVSSHQYTTTTQFVSTTVIQVATSNPCFIAGQPTGMFLRIAYDLNGTPVSRAQVVATHKEADDYCNGVLYPGSITTTAFTTNGTTEWFPLDFWNGGMYSFTVKYSGHEYNLSAQLQPVSVTCSTLYVPSGRTNTTISEPETTCPSSTYSVSPLSGIQLTLSLGSTTLQVGQNLSVTVSLFNTLPKVNTVRASDDWQFRGDPLGMWPYCFYVAPVEVLVLNGTYDLQELQAVAQAPLSYTLCYETVSVDHVVFYPMSDRANITGIYSVDSTNETYGPFTLTQNFTTRGFWGPYPTLVIGEEVIGPEVPYSTPFAPGNYTVAVADMWGQVVIDHFHVVSGP